MTDDEQAFLTAAAEEPDDDTLRLVYADWLDEQGGEVFATQAEFVRLQVERSRMDILDPKRVTLLNAETTLLKKHRRDWNGRIYRRFHRRGLRLPVDGRRGRIRRWDYHRGMIARVVVSAEGLAAHPDLVFSLGPIQSLKLAGWPATGWGQGDRDTLQRLLPRLKVFSLAGTQANLPLPDLTRLGGLGQVPLLDLRSIGHNVNLNQLLGLAVRGSISPIVLVSRRVTTVRTQRVGGRQYRETDSRETPSVIDPFGRWEGLRNWYSDQIGEVLSPIAYQGTSR